MLQIDIFTDYIDKISKNLLGDLTVGISVSMVLRINGLVALFFVWCTLQDGSTEDTFSGDRLEEMQDSDMDNDIVKGIKDIK